jgi:hypothetical protein
MSQSPKKSTIKTVHRDAVDGKFVSKSRDREFEVVEPAVGPKRFTRKQIRDAVRLVNKREAARGK